MKLRTKAYERDKERLQQLKGERLAQTDAPRDPNSAMTIKALRSQGADAAKAGDRLSGQVNDLRQLAQALELTKEALRRYAQRSHGRHQALVLQEEARSRRSFGGTSAVVLIEGKASTEPKNSRSAPSRHHSRQAQALQRKANKASNQTIAVTDASGAHVDLRGLWPLDGRGVIDRRQQAVDADCAGAYHSRHRHRGFA